MSKLNTFKETACFLYSMSYYTYLDIMSFDVDYIKFKWDYFRRDPIGVFLNYDEELQQKFIDYFTKI